MKKLILTVGLVTALAAAGGGLALSQAGKPGRQKQVTGDPAGQPPRPGRLPKWQRQGMKRPPFGEADPARQNRPNLERRRKRQLLQQRLFQELQITPEQRVRMQEIRRSFDDEAIGVGRRVRQARSALDRAIMSEPYDEQLIRKRADELAAAQSEQIRLRARMRGQVRGVLTPEQVMRFHEIERRLRRQMREEQQQMREQGGDTTRPPETGQTDLLSLLIFER